MGRRMDNVIRGAVKEQNDMNGLQILDGSDSHDATHDSVEYAPVPRPETWTMIVDDINPSPPQTFQRAPPLRQTSMFEGARIKNITGGSFNVTEQHGMTGLQILHRWGSHSAVHDSVEHAPVCHPETRKTIVGDLMNWIEDPSRSSKVLWFNGPAGAGKTAIAQTLCKLCEDKKWLAASYFFSRLAVARSDPARLFPTIAYQLSIAIPAVGKIIDDLVAKDPSIVTKKLKIQLQKLIVEPLQLVSALPIRPLLIIIDGLDECKGEGMQSHIIRLLGGVFNRALDGVLSRICFIVASRPEPWIRNEFDLEPLSRINRQIFLGQTAETNHDIRTFLRAGFTMIHESLEHHDTMVNVAKPWPSDRVLDDLVKRARGQFIYPATVLKFVDDPNYRPTERLDFITMASSAADPKPFAGLDQLYSQILSTSCNKKKTLDVLSVLLAMQDSLMTTEDDFKDRLPALTEQEAEWWQFSRIFRVQSLRIAENLLGLQPGDSFLALRTIHSLVHIPRHVSVSDVPDDDLSHSADIEFCIEDEIWFHHKSFIDYLLDPSRSLQDCVDVPQMHTQLALACLALMQTFSLQPPSRIGCVTWAYTILFWDDHLIGSGPPRKELLQVWKKFDIFGSYIDTLGPQRMQEECRNTIQRVVRPARVGILGKLGKKLSSKGGITDRKGPSLADIEVASNFLIHLGAGLGFTEAFYAMVLDNIVFWMEKQPNRLPQIKQSKIIVNILRYHSDFTPDNPAPPQPDHYFKETRRSRALRWLLLPFSGR